MSSSNCWFLTCIQISLEAGQVVWYSCLLKNFPQFVVTDTVKGFTIVNEAEVYVFLKFCPKSCDDDIWGGADGWLKSQLRRGRWMYDWATTTPNDRSVSRWQVINPLTALSLRWFALVGRERQPGSSDILSGNGMGRAVGEEDRQEPGVLWVPHPLRAASKQRMRSTSNSVTPWRPRLNPYLHDYQIPT